MRNREVPCSINRYASEQGDTAAEEAVCNIECTNGICNTTKCGIGIEAEVHEYNRQLDKHRTEEVCHLCANVDL